MAFNINNLNLTDNERNFISSRLLSRDQKAKIEREHGPAYAAVYETAYNEEKATALLKGYREGKANELARWREVMYSAEAKNREQSARMILEDTDLSGADVRKLLTTLPAGNNFLDRMAARTPLNLDADAPPQHAPGPGADVWGDVVDTANREGARQSANFRPGGRQSDGGRR